MPRVALLALLAAPALAAPTGPVHIAVGIAPAALCEVTVPVGASHTLTCTSGLPLRAGITVRPDGDNVAVDVSVETTGDQVDATDLTPAQRGLLERVAEGPVQARASQIVGPGMTGEFLGDAPEGVTPEDGPVGLTIRVTVPDGD